MSLSFLAGLVLFIFGTIVGSFLNVVIYRTTHGQSPAEGRSRCPHCNKQIRWYDNIPLLSFILLKGACRDCKQPISWQYPVVEFLTGILFVWWYMVGFAFFRLTQQPLVYIQPIFWLSIALLLLIIFVVDWRYYLIPDFAVAAIGILALCYRLYLGLSGVMQWPDVLSSLLMGVALCAFLWLLWWLTKGQGMGFGDVKYALVMGWLLGWPRGIVAMFLAFLLGSVVGVALLVSGKRKLKQRIAFGPFLIIGTVVSLVWGAQLWEWYWVLVG